MRIIRATAKDCPALTDLCLRAKASHGYDANFMAACIGELTVLPSHLQQRVFLVAWEGSTMRGCVSFDRDRCEIGAFFVAPEAQGRGVGRALWTEIRAVFLAQGVARVTLDADPNAVVFYEKLGFATIGASPSGSIPGRMIPRMAWTA